MAGKKVPSPKSFILSGRFSGEENAAFRKLAAARKLTISELVRVAMLAWKEGKSGMS